MVDRFFLRLALGIGVANYVGVWIAISNKRYETAFILAGVSAVCWFTPLLRYHERNTWAR